MIVIASYTEISDANNAKRLLEENGIPCQLKNELLSEEPPTIDKIDLLVEAKYTEQARDVLANAMGEDWPLALLRLTYPHAT